MLAPALAAVAWFTWPRPSGRRSHARWIRRAWLAFAGPALIGLALLGRLDALVAVPVEFATIADRLPRLDPVGLLPALALGVPIGGLVVLARVRWARWRRRPVPRYIVAPAPLAARRRAELLPATATALAAGVTEELAFRVFLPLSATLASGNAWLGCGLGTAVFVALHRYQSWAGRLGVAAIAVGLIALWLATGALWLVMLIHAVVDVMALAVRPWLAGFSSSGASRT